MEFFHLFFFCTITSQLDETCNINVYMYCHGKCGINGLDCGLYTAGIWSETELQDDGTWYQHILNLVDVRPGQSDHFVIDTSSQDNVWRQQSDYTCKPEFIPQIHHVHIFADTYPKTHSNEIVMINDLE